jgi:hypothetical protein
MQHVLPDPAYADDPESQNDLSAHSVYDIPVYLARSRVNACGRYPRAIAAIASCNDDRVRRYPLTKVPELWPMSTR